MTNENTEQPVTEVSLGERPKPKRKWYHFPRSWAEVKQLGWKFVVAFILFYLIRDSILYILLPWLAYEGIIAK